MKKKVTKFTLEITLNDKATRSYFDDLLDNEDIALIKILKKEDISIEVEE